MRENIKPIEFERVPVPVARRVLVGPAAAAVPSDWSSRRAAPDDESLRASTTQWIDELPAAVQPRELAQKYARIANRICVIWEQPLLCARYLAELLITRRNSRKGFPLDVALEISALGAHYEKLHPPSHPWT